MSVIALLPVKDAQERLFNTLSAVAGQKANLFKATIVKFIETLYTRGYVFGVADDEGMQRLRAAWQKDHGVNVARIYCYDQDSALRVIMAQGETANLPVAAVAKDLEKFVKALYLGQTVFGRFPDSELREKFKSLTAAGKKVQLVITGEANHAMDQTEAAGDAAGSDAGAEAGDGSIV